MIKIKFAWKYYGCDGFGNGEAVVAEKYTLEDVCSYSWREEFEKNYYDSHEGQASCLVYDVVETE